MNDIRWEFMQDSRDKKITARSARNTRTHNGKAGHVRLPSDNLTKKEREALNGECVKYASLKKPMTWSEFKDLPDDLKVEYIKSLREKFKVPNTALAEMFDISVTLITRYFKCLGLSIGSASGSGNRTWDREGFLAWRGGAEDGAVKPSETPVDSSEDELVAVNETPEITVAEPVYTDVEYSEELYEKFKKCVADIKPVPVPHICDYPYHHIPVIPKSGSMSFKHNNADDALATIKSLLSNIKVNITVSWEAIHE